MGAIISCVATTATWCFCSALMSLFGACCGNDKPSSVAPGAFSGRKRSVFLLVFVVALSFAFQYGVSQVMVNLSPGVNYVTEAWWGGCEELETERLQQRCIGNNGVYRVGFSAAVFFLLATVAVCVNRTANRVAWPAKYVLFVFLAVGMCFVPNEPIFSPIYLNIARVGAVVFVIIQQVIFVDLAHNWNDGWILNSDKAEAEESGSGKKWLGAILFSAAFLFICSIVGWVLLFHFYGGCQLNTIFIAVTVVLCILITMAQLSGEEGSLLASGIITAYATSLCYTAVARNPEAQCNPFLGDEDILGVVIGVTITLISLAYTGWSYTADSTLGKSNNEDQQAAEEEAAAASKEGGRPKIGGIVTNEENGDGDDEVRDDIDAAADIPDTFSNNWKLNVVLGTVSCWFSMAITAWGSIEDEGDAANPQVGKVSMWIIIASQWLCLTLYLWTLVAPRLLPDRDFS
ncbi:unnamed protein product [Cylindrotheca closterium]|uniref:Serine incorporator n=1 Tax=Cylindrotheca closterium TaxID=2856 RepID=A0AAD2GC93_9STRA|nr:unnamed protein product [Cylindrotheca closterium]